VYISLELPDRLADLVVKLSMTRAVGRALGQIAGRRVPIRIRTVPIDPSDVRMLAGQCNQSIVGSTLQTT
jgi:hypothetical protein